MMGLLQNHDLLNHDIYKGIPLNLLVLLKTLQARMLCIYFGKYLHLETSDLIPRLLFIKKFRFIPNNHIWQHGASGLCYCVIIVLLRYHSFDYDLDTIGMMIDNIIPMLSQL